MNFRTYLEASRISHLIKYSGVKPLLFYNGYFAVCDLNIILFTKAKLLVKVLYKMGSFLMKFSYNVQVLLILRLLSLTHKMQVAFLSVCVLLKLYMYINFIKK